MGVPAMYRQTDDRLVTIIPDQRATIGACNEPHLWTLSIHLLKSLWKVKRKMEAHLAVWKEVMKFVKGEEF